MAMAAPPSYSDYNTVSEPLDTKVAGEPPLPGTNDCVNSAVLVFNTMIVWGGMFNLGTAMQTDSMKFAVYVDLCYKYTCMLKLKKLCTKLTLCINKSSTLHST